MASVLDYFMGSPGTFELGPNQFNPQQQQVLQQLLQMGQQGLGTDAIEGAARRGYQQHTQPLLSERFANIGGKGLSGIGSSGYQNALISSGSDLESKLAALRQGNAMDLLKLGLQPQQESYFQPGQEGLAAPLIDAAARVGSAYLTGGGSEMGNIMQWFKGLFGGGQETPSSYSGIQAEATSPLMRRFANAPGHELLSQAAGSSVGLPSSLRQLPSQFQAGRMAQQGGVMNTQNLFKQAFLGGLPQAAQGANISALMNRFLPGFEL